VLEQRLRYILGLVLFLGFVVFVTPATVVWTFASTEVQGNPGSALRFGFGAAALLGLPGYFAFPAERRLQALAWLSLACLAYGTFIVMMFSLIHANPDILSSQDARSFARNTHVRFGYFLLIAAAEAAIFLALFKRRRTPDLG